MRLVTKRHCPGLTYRVFLCHWGRNPKLTRIRTRKTTFQFVPICQNMHNLLRLARHGCTSLASQRKTKTCENKPPRAQEGLSTAFARLPRMCGRDVPTKATAPSAKSLAACRTFANQNSSRSSTFSQSFLLSSGTTPSHRKG